MGNTIPGNEQPVMDSSLSHFIKSRYDKHLNNQNDWHATWFEILGLFVGDALKECK
jgi:hypothetical protein